MIHLLGRRIVFIIAISITLLSLVVAGSYYYLMPEQEKYDQEHRSLKGKISTKQAEIRQLKVEYDLLKDQIVKFNLLKNKGFFNAQDRVTARETIAQLTAQAKLMKADLNLPSAEIIQDPNATNANHVLISGPMNIKISSMSDQNIFKYMVALQNVFPGYLEFKSFDFKRKAGINQSVFKEIAKGKADPLMDGELQFIWWSMASPAQMEANPYFNPTAVTSPVLPVDATQNSGGVRP